MGVRLLGPLEVVSAAGRSVPIGGARERVVLVVLALARGATVSSDRLVDELWRDRPPADPLNVLRNVVMRLRRALAADATGLAVESRPGGYALAGDGGLDIDRADTLIACAERAAADGDQPRRLALLTDAVSLWRGEPLAGFEEVAGAAGERARLAELYLVAQEQRVDALLGLDRAADAAVVLDALCAENPLREPFWRQRMLALHRLGRVADAMDVARAYRRLLRDELGLDPGAGWRELEQRVLRDDPKLRDDAVAWPAGIVTFLHVEFDGSAEAASWRDWAHAVSEVTESLTGVVRSNRGVVCETGRDRFTAAFAEPADALSAAVAAQRTVTARDGAVAARTGVHTGEATPVDGVYRALAVHQLERVVDAAHPGQVLVTGAAAQRVGPGWSEGLALKPLGRFRILGFADSTELSQLVHPDLRSRFPSPRALAALAHNLPIPGNDLVGREEELDEVAALLASSRVVTLVGPPGVGKTRLAVEVANRAQADGACFVGLASVGDGHLVPAVVAEAVGISPGSGGSVVAALADALSARPALLVLDNCEHVAEAAADFVEALVRACPAARVLATSREPLDLDEESIWRLAPLAVPPALASFTATNALQYDAVRLLVVRAGEADPTFALDDATADTLCHVVRALDGLPLTLELAAPILGALGLDELHRGLDDRLDLLDSGQRRNARQAGVRAALEWSHALLLEHEQVLYRRMSVFAGPEDLETVTQVCGEAPLDERLIRRAAAKLVARSLVMRMQQHGRTRFGLLETIKLHAAEQLDHGGESDEVRRRHADWVAEQSAAIAVDETLVPTERTGRLLAMAGDLQAAARFLVDHDPSAALRLLVGCRPAWDWMCRWAEIVRLLDTALERTDDTEPLVRASALQIQGFALMWSDVPRARDVLTEAAELFGKCDNLREQGLALQRVAGIEVSLGDLDEATRLAEEAMAVKRRDGHRGLIAFGQQELVNIAMARGDYVEAMRILDEAIPVVFAEGSPVAGLRFMSTKARCLRMLGRRDEALAIALEVQRGTAETPSAEPFNTFVNRVLAEIALDEQRYADTARLVELDLADTGTGEPMRLSPLLALAGRCAVRTGEVAAGVGMLATAAAIHQRGGLLIASRSDAESEADLLLARERLGPEFHYAWLRGARQAPADAAAAARAVLAAIR